MHADRSFGHWLKRQRKSLDLTREELAERVGYSVETLRKVELGQRRPSRQLAEAVLDALDIPAEQRAALIALARSIQPVDPTPPAAVRPAPPPAAPDSRAAYQDWGEAPDVSLFSSREAELQTLAGWIIADGCRLISVIGMGGIGKTMLVAKLAQDLLPHFEFVLWRSLINAPALGDLIGEWIECLADSQPYALPDAPLRRIALLLDYLRQRRCLLILDNAESLLHEGAFSGRYRQGYEEYGELIRRIGESGHQSCLVLTSREKPRELGLLEGPRSLARSLPLSGLPIGAAQALLDDKGLVGTGEEWLRLVECYNGNPLALKIVAEMIRLVFDGHIEEFLTTGGLVFGDIFELLREQLGRLSGVERELVYWLAVAREPITFEELRADLLAPLSPIQLAESLASLRQRALIEKHPAGFTLQNVVMEFATRQLIAESCAELAGGAPDVLVRHALLKAEAKEYIRETQQRLILAPIADELLATFGRPGLVEAVRGLVARLRAEQPHARGYAGGNCINLLTHLGADLAGADFSGLAIWQAYLRGVPLHGVNMSAADLARSVFTDTFGNVLCIAFSPDGALLAAGMTDGEIRIWRVSDRKQQRVLEGHRDWVRSLDFSPDGRRLASGGDDQAVRIWDVASGACQEVLDEHSGRILAVAFSPDGGLLATGGEDRTVRLWDARDVRCLRVLAGHGGWVCSVRFSPDSRLLASGGSDRRIYVWDVPGGERRAALECPDWVWVLRFSPDGRTLASAGGDQSIQLWDVPGGRCARVLTGHSEGLFSLAWSPNGQLLASGSNDQTIRLWDVPTGHCCHVLHGHTKWVRALDFSPDGQVLASGGNDQSIRFWDVPTGRCCHILQGYVGWVWSLAWSADGRILASSGDDQVIRLWDSATGQCRQTLNRQLTSVWAVAFGPDSSLAIGNAAGIVLWDIASGQTRDLGGADRGLIRTIAFSPGGRLIASGSEDQTIRVYDVESGRCVRRLDGHRGWVWSVAFSPDGRRLASGCDDQSVRIWDVASGRCERTLLGHSNSIWSVAFGPAGDLLASGCDDQSVRIWDVASGACLRVLAGHTAQVWSVAFSPGGDLLASGGADGTVRLWDAATGEPCGVMLHPGRVRTVAFNHDGSLLASGGSDSNIRLWDVRAMACRRVLAAPKPYQGLNISGVSGLSELQHGMLRALGAVDQAGTAALA
ncbi:MAG TPA: helix-turn-helix domain-containing protein [Herpetosiphonaceae bacterium]|nr:helix-turn-helix domain-containing protein [Herpetosiphonaceae bacterium]